MHHIAIMKKSWHLVEKIISSEKTIESRWYMNKHDPWGKAKSGDMIYFKNSGEPVTAKARATNILQFEELTPDKIKHILNEYHKELGIDDIEDFYVSVKNKKL
ncbi:MAG: hypothetical protein HZB65_00120 [Candidatus Aenigmarchaeota archaeon]|nr:hypothetical protein [Candidatus Aenigmarchaeota archaeon]